MARPTVMVSVGHGHAVRVLLDTGSSGLRLFTTAVPSGPTSGVTTTATRSSLVYAGGFRLRGVVADAVVTVGGRSTARAVPFGLVQSAVCKPAQPTCQASSGIGGFIRQTGTRGILGIGMERNGGLVSVLPALAGALGHTWSLHLAGRTGHLVLGAGAPPRSGAVATFHLRATGRAGSTTLWADDALPLCVSVGDVRGCARGILDSGTFAFQVQGPTFAAAAPSGSKVPPGTAVQVRPAGAARPFWVFTSGTTRSKNLVVTRARKASYVNTGVQAFLDFTVTYTDGDGTITLSR